ncbi:MAG: hypothetical protein ACJ8FS_16510 [Sphingomicrobium sp.]
MPTPPYDRTGRRAGVAFLILSLVLMLLAFATDMPAMMLAGFVFLIAAVLAFPS